MFQDLIVVVASALLAPVAGIGVVALIRKIRWSLASRAEERVLSQPSAEQLTSNRVASAAIAQPTPIPAWPRLVRNPGVALLAVAVVAFASIAISSNLVTATPSGGVLGAARGIASSGPVSSPTAPGTTRSKAPGVSAAVIAALRGTAVVNDRLAVDADFLQTEQARKSVRAIDLARQLRALVSDAELGASLANRLEAWPDADPLRSDLKSFYEAVAETARDGLRAPLSDRAAYRSAASRMLTLVADLRAIDAASRDLAETVPVELAPISVPLPE